MKTKPWDGNRMAHCLGTVGGEAYQKENDLTLPRFSFLTDK